MKQAAVFLLPLVASAAVLPEKRHTVSEIVQRQVDDTRGDQLLSKLGSMLNSPTSPTASKVGNGKTWMDTLGQIGGMLNKGFKTVNGAVQSYNDMQMKIEKALPDIFHTAVPSLATMLQWVSKPIHTSSIPPVLEPTLAKKTVIRYGPFDLMGQKYNRTAPLPFFMDPKADVIIRQLKGLPQNAAILSGRMDTVFEDGTKADISKGIYIHHLLVADVGKNTAPFAACPGGRNQDSIGLWMAYHVVNAVGAGLIQSGNDQVGDANTYYSNTGGVKSAFLTGYDDAYLLEAEVVNYNQENTTVYLQMEAEYLPEKPDDIMDASTVLFSATGCNNPGYRPKRNAKKYNFTSEPFVMDYDGVMVNNRGHLHDGGVAMHMLLNDKLVCESLPNYGSAPGSEKDADGKEWKTILSMSRCDYPVPFKKGDQVKLVSIYDVDQHPLRQGVSEGGHSHGGAKKEGGAPDPHGGMEGMEEMGIFTTNIAVARNKMLDAPKIPAQQAAPSNPKTGTAPAAAPPKSGEGAAAMAPAAAPPKAADGMASMPGHSEPKAGGEMASMKGHSHSRRMTRSRLLKKSIPLPEAIYPVVKS